LRSRGEPVGPGNIVDEAGKLARAALGNVEDAPVRREVSS